MKTVFQISLLNPSSHSLSLHFLCALTQKISFHEEHSYTVSPSDLKSHPLTFFPSHGIATISRDSNEDELLHSGSEMSTTTDDSEIEMLNISSGNEVHVSIPVWRMMRLSLVGFQSNKQIMLINQYYVCSNLCLLSYFLSAYCYACNN